MQNNSSIFSRKSSLPPPLDLNGSPVEFKQETVYLDSSLTWRKHIEYSVQKFYFAKYAISYLLYSDMMSFGNKILLFRTVLMTIFLYV